MEMYEMISGFDKPLAYEMAVICNECGGIVVPWTAMTYTLGEETT